MLISVFQYLIDFSGLVNTYSKLRYTEEFPSHHDREYSQIYN